eukprot:g1294.t1
MKRMSPLRSRQKHERAKKLQSPPPSSAPALDGLGGPTRSPSRAEDYEKPIFDLPGPLRPPAAPARYKALTKIRLRVAPHKFADLVTPTYEIQEGEEFRVLEAKTDESDPGQNRLASRRLGDALDPQDPGVLWLRTGQDSGAAWFLERGIIGKFAGKKLARRVCGSLEVQEKGPAVMQISEVPDEVAAPTSSTSSSSESEEADQPEAPSPLEKQKSILELLEDAVDLFDWCDPEIQSTCKEMGIDMETMKKNPEFVEAMARQLYGDDAVA